MAKLDNKKLLACCANGAGSSLMMENAIKKVMKKYDIKYGELRHCSVSEGKSAARTYDVIFCARTFAKNFEELGAKEEDIPKLVDVLLHGNGGNGTLSGFMTLGEEDCTKIYQLMV